MCEVSSSSFEIRASLLIVSAAPGLVWPHYLFENRKSNSAPYSSQICEMYFSYHFLDMFLFNLKGFCELTNPHPMSSSKSRPLAP